METEENMVQKLKVCTSCDLVVLEWHGSHDLGVSHMTSLPAPTQHACGYEYTAKLQKMLVDIKLSTSITQEFHERMKSSVMSGYSVLVLQVTGKGVVLVLQVTGRGVVLVL